MRKSINLFLIVILLINTFLIANAEERKLLIMPFQVETGGCPICKGIFQKGEVLLGSEVILTRILYEKIESKGIFKVISAQKVNEVIDRYEKNEIKKAPLSFSLKVGRELNAQFLLIGFLFRYENRIGSSIGVEKPSSVGFDLHLIRLNDGLEVWRGRFDETQRPLSENILKIGSFLRRRASWLTAEELSRVGMDEILKTLDRREFEGE